MNSITTIAHDPTSDSPAPPRVVVVGGGAAGTLVATHLIGAADRLRPVDVSIVERGTTIGPGLAYQTRHPLHLLNNFAGRLSALGRDPDHLLRWCADHGIDAQPQSFLPRGVYGDYLVDTLDGATVPDGSALRRVRGDVVDVEPTRRGYVVHMSCGWRLPAENVVLAVGNPPPSRREDLEACGDRYHPNPWSADVSTGLESADRVLLVGTGLTMVDVAATIHAAAPSVQIVAASRHGLLPATHVHSSVRPHDSYHPGRFTLSTLLPDIRRRVAEVEEVGGDWRDVIDSIRMFANDLWRHLREDERERFVRHLARRWEIHRHRMAPAMSDHVDELQARGVLRVVRSDAVDPATFDRIVNCTGPAPVTTPGWSPLMDALTERGLVRTNHLGLGLDFDDEGRLLGATAKPNPGLFAVGYARRGVEWEVAAIPDIRSQSARLAATLLPAVSQCPDIESRPATRSDAESA